MDAGEGVAVHGTDAEPTFLLEDGKAKKKSRSAIRCPGHGVIGKETDALVKVPPIAPLMDIYVIGDDADPIEIDYCSECGGFYFDAGEGVALLELARRAEAVIESRSGAQFVAPPSERQEAAIDEWRQKKGRSLFTEMVKGMLHGTLRYRIERRRHRHLAPNYDRLYDDWE